MIRLVVAVLLLVFGSEASSQRPPDSDISSAAYVARALADADESEAQVNWALISGAGGYLVGAAGGVYLSYVLVPADSVRGHRVPLRIAAGVVGGTLASATAVYAANGAQGNLPLMVGGAFLGQAVGVGAAAALILVDAILGAKEPGFSWMGISVVLGAPFLAAVGADYVSDWTGRP